ncbi:heparinase II/III family protein [Alteripontixanthobacter maritimus]|nr:heparinase II/III family protein [Alteripontixanthobacter maritimus]
MAIPLAPGRDEPAAEHGAKYSGSDDTDLQPETKGSELLEPGRALVVSDFTTPRLNPGEKLIRLAYRMGIPSATIVAPFRKAQRTRLLAKVKPPEFGDRSAGMALRAGHFLIYGVKAPIAQMDYATGAPLTPPFERAIHGFGWMRDLAACGTVEQVANAAGRVTSGWLAANPKPARGPAWKVEHTGHRLLAWLVHAPLVLDKADDKARTQILQAISDTARWLDRNVTKADDQLGAVAGWAAITAAGLLLPDGKPRRIFGEAGLVRALGELVADDGGVLSRSPLAQMDAITVLTDLAACYEAAGRDVPEALDTMRALLVPPLLALVHSDGRLGSWQGANSVRAPRLAALIAASGVRTRPLKDVRQWGYQRIAAGKSVLQLDAAPPPLARHARWGCASTLAFELSSGDHRIIVNCGGAAVAGGQTPVRIEQGLRATAAHSTLVLDDANSTAVHIKGKLGAGVTEVEVDRRTLRRENGTATRIEASHDGYGARYGLTHRRILIMKDDGDELRGEDVLVPSGKNGKRGKIGFAIRFHIGLGIEIGLAEDRLGAGLALPDGSYWQFRVGNSNFNGEVAVEESLWVDGQGRPQPIQQLVIQGMTSRGGGRFSWLLKKTG